jgi:hypothetical protein
MAHQVALQQFNQQKDDLEIKLQKMAILISEKLMEK